MALTSMREIELLPKKAKSKHSESLLFPSTMSAALEIEQFFHLSGTPFFKEYTDHTFRHSVEVFESACDMLPETAWDAISSEDINILLLASLMHDAGLHITEDLFLILATPSNTEIRCPD